MTKNELIELLSDFNGADEVSFVSPGGWAFTIGDLDWDLINKTGRIVLRAEWILNDSGYKENLEPKPRVRKVRKAGVKKKKAKPKKKAAPKKDTKPKEPPKKRGPKPKPKPEPVLTPMAAFMKSKGGE